MAILFWFYFASFVILSAAGVYDSATSPRGRRLVTIEIAAVLAAAAGMLCFWFQPSWPSVRHLWKPVLALIIVAEGATAVEDLRESRRDPEYGAFAAWAGILLALAFIVPSVWMNWRFAFGDEVR
jgi:hypothetical protein